MQYSIILLKIYHGDNRIVCKETKTMNNRHPKPSSTRHPSSSFSPPSFWDFACKASFPLPSTGCYFVLYKSISERPNSLNHTQEGFLLFWLQKSLFHLFHPFIQTCWIRFPLLLSLISYHVCHGFSGSAEKNGALAISCILTILITYTERLSSQWTI